MNEQQQIRALEIELEYMETSRDAWQREAEALRAAMLKWSRRAHDLECDATFRNAAADNIQQHTKSRLENRRILQPIQRSSATSDSSEKAALRNDIKTSEKARQIVEQILQIFDANIGVDSTVNSASKSSLNYADKTLY